MQLQWAVTRDRNRLSIYFISQKCFFYLVLLYFIIKLISKKNINFSLYTLVQNLTFSKKANNSMKNSNRVANNTSNNRYFFALFFCSTKFKFL